ncbi:MAG: methionine adenosyltransferase [Candidatus Latescibacteria bacterium]|nr:methionine adenosyltransferase [Candidatus Latescibacterota bacterium]
MAGNYSFTSESVSEGHPDKVCDRISDSIVDAAMAQDPMSRVACESLCTTGLIIVSGEITTKAVINYAEVARQACRDIGYTDPDIGFDADSCGVLTSIHPQSPDISQGVTEGKGLFSDQGAGDQGMMFGFACDDTPELMPMPIQFAQRLVMKLAEIRKAGEFPYLKPDSKSQVTVEYVDGKPKRVASIVISTQHAPDVSLDIIRSDMEKAVIREVIPAKFITGDTKLFVNPTGRFVVGGPHGDTGLTGRKIIVDTYGGMGRHGGGAFSGKDCTKVDRSAAYAARYAAKNIVAAGLAERCEVALSYAIGVPEPTSVNIDTFGTGKVNDLSLCTAVRDCFEFRPKGIIDMLDLRRPIYEKTAAYGHFGRNDPDFTWEKTDKVDELQKAVKL